jgi:hypothetical protein
MFETILAIATPIGAAIAWIWNESRKSRKEEHEKNLDLLEREHSYASRLEARLKARDEEIERLMLKVISIDCHPEDAMKSLVTGDPGVSWIKKRISKDNYFMLCVSPGYARVLGEAPDVFTGSTTSEEVIYASQVGTSVLEEFGGTQFTGRKFPVNLDCHYIVGIFNEAN